MKYLLFIVLLMAILITAGCVSGDDIIRNFNEKKENAQVQPFFIPNTVTPTSTPTSTPTPTPTPTVASSASASSPTYSSQPSASSPTHFSGHGDDVRSFTITGTGLRIFTMSHTGSSNFAIWLKDSSGNNIALLVNEIGSYSGKKSERLTSGTYYLDITADGSWTIDISSM